MYYDHMHVLWPCWCARPADCEHEVKPVRSGYRLCLIYNLVCRDPGPLPSAGDPTGGAVHALKGAVQEWAADKRGPEKLCYMLEHRWVSLRSHAKFVATCIMLSSQGCHAEQYVQYGKGGLRVVCV